LFDGMSQGQPVEGDQGLDKTHTWGRTYWGGALFYLVADVEIRRATANRKGLQDALRAIAASGAMIDTERPLLDVLRTGDQATGVTVLEDLSNDSTNKPIAVDLHQLWSELGIHRDAGGITFDQTAPLADIRRTMTKQPSK
jgi:hypothetical protein